MRRLKDKAKSKGKKSVPTTATSSQPKESQIVCAHQEKNLVTVSNCSEVKSVWEDAVVLAPCTWRNFHQNPIIFSIPVVDSSCINNISITCNLYIPFRSCEHSITNWNVYSCKVSTAAWKNANCCSRGYIICLWTRMSEPGSGYEVSLAESWLAKKTWNPTLTN